MSDEITTNHQAYNDLQLYRNYASQRISQGKDFELFSEWINEMRDLEKEMN